VAAAVGVVLVCAVTATLRVVLSSSNGRTRTSDTAANTAARSAGVRSADGAATAPVINLLTPLSPSADPSPKGTAGASSASASSSAAHQQPGTGTGVLPAAVGDWPLNIPASGSNSVADIAGSHPGTAANVQWGGAAGNGGYGVFNGTNSLISTFGPVVDTGPGSSYTVSAWIYPVQYDSSEYMTAVSQDGGPEGNSAFYITFWGPSDRWVFLVPGASGAASSTSPPALDTWTHLVGVYDDADNQVRLYIDGTLEGTATYDSTYAASTGSLVIGRAAYGGVDCDWFQGDVRDVEVFNQALTTSAVDDLR
jgi:hypothetical protein